MVPIENRAESPGAIFRRDLMRQALHNQPFQYAIQGHPIKMLASFANPGFDIVTAPAGTSGSPAANDHRHNNAGSAESLQGLGFAK